MEGRSELPAADPRSGMRATGFALTVVGALVAGVGVMLPWVTAGGPNIPAEVSPTWPGADLLEGRLALALAVVALIAVLVSRVGSGARSRRGAASVALIAGLLIVAIAGAEVVTAGTRFVNDAIREFAAAAGVPVRDLPDEFREQLEVRLGVGVWLTLAGGLLTIAGGLVTLAWTTRRVVPVEPR